jgi:hypothetical protein
MGLQWRTSRACGDDFALPTHQTIRGEVGEDSSEITLRRTAGDDSEQTNRGGSSPGLGEKQKPNNFQTHPKQMVEHWVYTAIYYVKIWENMENMGKYGSVSILFPIIFP